MQSPDHTDIQAMDSRMKKAALAAQRTEITEASVYSTLARLSKNKNNAEVLDRIGREEAVHAAFWKSKTGMEIGPDRLRVFLYVMSARILGLTFVLKQMERREGTGSAQYARLVDAFPEARKLSEDEARHEKSILAMLDEELLLYIGSIVLGLNDALVELTGALAGFTLALANSRLISLAGLITGISAAFSMAASDYLSSKAEGDSRAAKSALYTGSAYLITVILLILPFLLLSNKFASLAITLAIAVAIIYAFNYYLSVAKDLDFKQRFLEMTGISLGVATFSFFVGWLLKALLGIDV